MTTTTDATPRTILPRPADNVAPVPCDITGHHPHRCTIVSARVVARGADEHGGSRFVVRGIGIDGRTIQRTYPHDFGARDPWAAAVALWVGDAWLRPHLGAEPVRGDDVGTNAAGRVVRRYTAHARYTR